MKNKIKLLGAFVIVVLVGYSISACASSGSGSNSSASNEPIVWTNVRDIAYGNGIFVAVGGGTRSSGKIAYSNDGINWTDVAEPSLIGNYAIEHIAYGGGIFVAGGSRSRIWHSTDGINWTAHPDNTERREKIGDYVRNSRGIINQDICGIIYVNGRFIVCGNQGSLAYSTDGINWIRGTIRRDGRNFFTNSIAFGNGRFVTVGTGDGEPDLDGIHRGRYAYSTDGINWTAYASDIFVSEVKGASVGSVIGGIIYGNDKFVIWGGDARYRGIQYDTKIAYSSNGTGYIPVSNTTFGTDRILDMAYGNGRFVAVGRNGKIAYSTDGINWTAVLDPAFGFSNISTITYGGGKFIAVGGGGSIMAGRSGEIKMAYSTDGTNWTPIPFGESNQ